MASYLSGSGQAAENLLAEEWVAGFDVEAQEKAVLWPQVRQLPRPRQILHLPRLDTISSSVFSTSLAGTTGLTFSSNAETEFTATSRMRIIPLEISFDTLQQTAADPVPEWKEMFPKSLGSGIDSDVLALASSLTTSVLGSNAVDLSYGLIAEGHRDIVTNAKEFFEPRERSRGICVVAATQDDHLISIDQLINAQIRGDRMNPVVTGWVATAVGFDFYESTNVQVTGGNTANNIMLVPRALGIGFNQRPTVFEENFQVWRRVIAWSHYAYGAIREEYASLIRTKSAV
jgi:hypothetical protein